MYFKGKIWYFCALMKFRKKIVDLQHYENF